MALVMAVDDEELVRHVLGMLLTDAGHRTVEAAQGAEALDRIREERPDRVIADVMMPILDGAALCRLLKAGGTKRS